MPAQSEVVHIFDRKWLSRYQTLESCSLKYWEKKVSLLSLPLVRPVFFMKNFFLPVRLTGEPRLQCGPPVTSHSVAVAIPASVRGAQLLQQINIADTKKESGIRGKEGEKRVLGNVEKISRDGWRGEKADMCALSCHLFQLERSEGSCLVFFLRLSIPLSFFACVVQSLFLPGSCSPS